MSELVHVVLPPLPLVTTVSVILLVVAIDAAVALALQLSGPGFAMLPG